MAVFRVATDQRLHRYEQLPICGICLKHLERQAGRDLADADGQPGQLQRRRGVECDDRHPRRAAGHRVWAAGAVLCRRCGQDLRQFRGGEETRARPQAVLSALCWPRQAVDFGMDLMLAVFESCRA